MSAFHRFTQQARDLLLQAQSEAYRLRHEFIGTEHLLLGMIQLDDGFAILVLSFFDAPLLKLKSDIESLTVTGNAGTDQEIGLNLDAKLAIEYAVAEARSMGHDHIGTGHLLLGIVRESDGIGGRVLRENRIWLEDLILYVRKSAVRILSGATPASEKLDAVIIASLSLLSFNKERLKPSTRSWTDHSLWALTFSIEEAHKLNHNYVGTEHLLLGLVREVRGLPSQLLKENGIELPNVRTMVEEFVGRGEGVVVEAEVGLSPRAKRAIAYAGEERDRLNHSQLGAEHLFLGIIVEEDGTALNVLKKMNVEIDTLRDQILKLASPYVDFKYV